MDHSPGLALSAATSDRPARIVYAKPPGKGAAPYKPAPSTNRAAPPPEPRPALSSAGAIVAFLDLMRQ